MKKKNYTARWAQPGQPSIANVSIMETHDVRAIQTANRIARQLGVTNTPRTIYEGERCVQVLSKGVSDNNM